MHFDNIERCDYEEKPKSRVRKKLSRKGDENGKTRSSVKTCDLTKSCRQKASQMCQFPGEQLSVSSVDNESTISKTAYELVSTPATPITSQCGCPCHKPGNFSISKTVFEQIITEFHINRIHKHAPRRHFRHLQNMWKLPGISNQPKPLHTRDAKIDTHGWKNRPLWHLAQSIFSTCL